MPRFIDPLRLSPEVEQKLLADLWEQAEGYAGDERRQEPRYPCDERVELIVEMRHPGSSEPVRYLVRPRDISRGGVGFLHGGFVYEGTCCRTILLTAAGEPLVRDGQAVRCRHVRGHVHEVGLRFEKVIDPERFVASRDAQAEEPAASEAVDSQALPGLSGRVMYVDASADSRALFEYVVGDSGITRHVVSDAIEALQHAGSVTFDLVLTEVALPEMTGLELVQALREAGCQAPVVAMTAEEVGSAKACGFDNGFAEYLFKPLSAEVLLPTLARYLGGEQRRPHEPLPPLSSQKWQEVRLRPLILDFLRRLGPQLDEMELALQEGGPPKRLSRPALELKAAALGYGYPLIGAAAAELHKGVSATGSGAPAELRQHVEKLRALHQAACMAPEIDL